MARTKQTKSTRVKAPRKQLPETFREIMRDQKLPVQDIKMSPAPVNWQNLPHNVFGDIMIMMGRGSLQDFTKEKKVFKKRKSPRFYKMRNERSKHDHFTKCRQVCQSWNVKMSQMTKYEKDTIRREAESLASEIREKCFKHFHSPCLPEIVPTSSLAHHGMFGSLQIMVLSDMDLASVRADHLASLVSCVTYNLVINKVRNCDLTRILDSVKCEWLCISKQTLSSEEPQALVRAMESGVER